MDLPERFGANLRLVRHEHGWTQEELGERCNLHRTEISLLERGKRKPQLETFLKLARVADVATDRLCEGIEWSAKVSGFEVVETTLLPPRVRRPPAPRPSR